jgi:diguanylate cyclase (GGDEF)-like protein
MWIYSKFSDHSRTISIAIFLFFISIVIALSIISMRLMFRYLQSYKFNQRDDLTTLYTKMTGLSKIGQILVESNKSLYVAMLDIDNFKMVNDIYGHLEGDELLKKISVIIREATKDKDVLCRFGGDEFVICLVSETEQSALEVFSNILKKWSGLSENYSKVDMGVSIGYCEGCRSKGNGSSTAKSIIKKADIALYKVKQNGKKGIYQYKEEYIKSNTI